jgi:beta-N-acetylhexosaminidase
VGTVGFSGRAVRVALAALLALPAAGCTGGTERAEPEQKPSPAALAVLRQASGPRTWGLARAASGVAEERPLPIRTGWGPTRKQIDRAQRLVGEMSLRERAGEVILARYAGTGPPTDLVNGLHLGGVVVFSENITGTDQIRASNQALQRAVVAAGRPFGVDIGLDQEGGAVERVTTGTRFPAFMTAGAAGQPSLTHDASAASGAELAGLGFTTDYAPDSDVTIGSADPAIGARSAGSSPEVVASHVLAAARGYRSSGIVPVLKHFPGHGSVTADSHLTLPVQPRSVAELADRDLVPFAAGIDAGLPSLMVGHLDVRAVDPGMPSSLSRKVVTGLLRKRLGFAGVATTDSLAMHAISDRFDSGEAAVRALRAGEDLVMMPPSPRAARDGIVRAVRSGGLSSARLIQAATRHVALLIHRRAQGSSPQAPGSAWDLSAQWSAAALTSVAGPCSGPLVDRRVRVTGPPTAVTTFRAAAEDAGLRVTRKKGPTIRLVGRGDPPAKGKIVVALDTPYVLGSSTAAVAKLATYGQTPGAMAALVAFLQGRAPAPGHLPVAVAGVDRAGC